MPDFYLVRKLHMLIGYTKKMWCSDQTFFKWEDTDTFTHLQEEHRRLKYSDTFYGVDGTLVLATECGGAHNQQEGAFLARKESFRKFLHNMVTIAQSI